jgi:hypothetical protein
MYKEFMRSYRAKSVKVVNKSRCIREEKEELVP